MAFVIGCFGDDEYIFEQTQNELMEVGYNTSVKDISSAEGMALKDMTPVEIYDEVENMPSFPGGMDELMKYLAQNIHYPIAAQEKGVQGSVILQFVVDADGFIGNVNVLRGVESSLDEEAIRVVENMPKWEPGILNGEKVSVRYTLPVIFRLQ